MWFAQCHGHGNGQTNPKNVQVGHRFADRCSSFVVANYLFFNGLCEYFDSMGSSSRLSTQYRVTQQVDGRVWLADPVRIFVDTLFQNTAG